MQLNTTKQPYEGDGGHLWARVRHYPGPDDRWISRFVCGHCLKVKVLITWPLRPMPAEGWPWFGPADPCAGQPTARARLVAREIFRKDETPS